MTDRAKVLHGDCLELLPTLEENSIDAVVCDPPYHLQSIVKRFGAKGAAPAKHGTDGAFARASKGFMGKQWDGGDVAFRTETWAAIYRVMKPGAYLFAFSGSRTFCRVGVAIEDAGFIMHPVHGWIFGQGFPKGHKVKDPAWEGWAYGTQSTKPALEPILMAQKPMSEKTGTANVLRWGTGAINIHGCRVAFEGNADELEAKSKNQHADFDNGARGNVVYGNDGRPRTNYNPPGRHPANVLHDGSSEVLAAFADFGEKASGKPTGIRRADHHFGQRETGTPITGFGDVGSAARFFYAAKASEADRAGSDHPTVKPLSLMRYLCRLVTPPGGIVLDPFAGSGTTLQAALEEGFQTIGIEREDEYIADIHRRLDRMSGADTPLFEALQSNTPDLFEALK